MIDEDVRSIWERRLALALTGAMTFGFTLMLGAGQYARSLSDQTAEVQQPVTEFVDLQRQYPEPSNKGIPASPLDPDFHIGWVPPQSIHIDSSTEVGV